METVYLETTFVSYLIASPFRDLVVAAHQQITRDWRGFRRDKFHCLVSQVVLDEISAGDAVEAKKRCEAVNSLQVLEASSEAERLTQAIMDAGILPPMAVRDAAHIAVASVHGVEYLLTWNCRHLANAQIARRAQHICDREGFTMPEICTPEELLEDIGDEP